MNAHKISKNALLDAFIEADSWARQYAENLINKKI
jgi:hypothetical protein